MFRYIKSADMEDADQVGLETLWNNSSDRDNIIRSVYTNMSSQDIVETLQNNLSDDEFKTVMIALAKDVEK